MPRIAMNSRRSRTSCSLMAVATVLAVGATPATAQSFNGTGTFVNPAHGSINQAVAGQTTVTLNSGVTQAVINWTPTDNNPDLTSNVIFQNAGTTATFNGQTNFAVLNNINAPVSRVVEMNGLVQARIGGVQGGSLYFYAPGGFLFGGTSSFSVGSLVASALPIATSGSTFITGVGTTNTVQFQQALNSSASITSNGAIDANFQIFGVPTGTSNYVALVAPRIVHTGTITVNGSAALVAAEAATISFSPDGLFDIQMTVGTDDPNGLIVTGDIGGDESPDVTDKHRVFLAAVPKNDAVTMLISNGANLGFDIAGAADIDGNAIVLSAGHNIVNGLADTTTVAGSGADANISISNSNFTSAVFGTATGFADVSASGATTSFASDLTLKAVDRSFINAAFTGGLLDIAGDLNVDLSVFGQTDGQSVTAGHAALYAHGDSLVTIGGDVTITANAYGANSSTAGVHAGDGTGGFIQVQGQDVGGSVMIAGNVTLQANGYGGEPDIAGINAGDGFGGTAIIGTFGSGQTLQINGAVTAEASGFGGGGDGSECLGCNGLGGLGDGGLVQLFTFDGSGSSATFNGTVDLIAIGEGGRSASAGVASANGIGGDIDFTSSAGTLTFAQNVTADATGRGGDSETAGIAAGIGVGGDVFVTANTNSTIQFNGTFDAVANGDGGVVNTGVNGGNGFGGRVIVSANGSKGVVTFNQDSNFFADGNASDMVGDCLACGAIGGNGFGGEVSFSGSSGGLIDATGIMELSASGWGGTGVTGAAGNGTGGTVLVYAPTGMTIDVTGSLQLDASGHGGFNEGGFAAGSGTGNSARVHADGGQITVTGSLEVDADGFGGDSFGGNGGTGTGGLAEILTTGSTALLTVTGNALLEADGSGGSSFNEGPIGDGGDGFGGQTRAVANDGTIHITGNLIMDATSTGGFGQNGGDAAGVITPPEDENAPSAAFLWAGASTAELRVDGLTDIDVSATGGDAGFGGNGGNASAGEIDIVSELGEVLLGDVMGNAEAYGGTGGFGGGAGGNATGGDIDVAWSILGGALTGTISGDSFALSVTGYGGNGGDGISADVGGNGGDGGDGTGGTVAFIGNAAGGTFNVGATTILADGHGGIGGNGGSGDTGPGGNGAAGGTGTGGLIQTGNLSYELNPGSGGTATFTTLLASASATGGAGGSGGEGGGGLGTGGDGGDAIAGEANFLVRGIPITADSVSLFANATGGNGGSGSTAGNGGDAWAGFISVESKDRFDHPTQRGSLTANSITGTAIAQGGTGTAPGTSTVRGGSFFRVLNGDANIGSLSFTFAGDEYDGTFGPNYIQAQDGTATIGTFSYDTTGQLAIYTTSTGALDVGDLFLSAGNFIDHPTLPGPASPGTIFATNLSVTSGGDFIADANINVINGIDITVPGSIRFDNAQSISFVDLWAQGGSIDLDDVTSDGDVNLTADGFIDIGVAQAGFFRADSFNGGFTSNNITSDSDIRIFADENVTTGDLAAGLPAGESSKAIRIDTNGSVLVGDMVALGGIDVTADGSVTGQNVITGDVLITDANGAITYGNISAGLINPQPFTEFVSVGLNSATSISVGDVEGAQILGFITSGPLIAGDLSGGSDVLGLVHGNMTIGDINAGGRVLLADSSMFTNAGGTIGNGGDNDINPEDIFSAVPVRTGGSITVGDVFAGSFTAAAGTSLTTGIIDTDSGIALGANNAILTGNLFAGDFVLANGGSITTGNIEANSVDMTSTGGNITTGNIGAFGAVELAAFADILTGDIVAGSIDLLAGDDITTGDLTTQQLVLLSDGIHALLFPGASITLEAGGDISTGDISSIDGVFADAGGGISTGNILAVDFISLNAIGNIAFLSANAGTSFDFETDGSVNGGNVVAGATIEGEAGGTVTLGNLTAGFDPGEFVDDDDFSIGIAAAGSIDVDNVSGAEAVGFATLANLTTGNVGAGGLFMTLVGGNIATGSIATTGENSQVYMADDSMFITGGGTLDGEGDFDPSIVLALDPVMTGGSITINGPVDTNLFRAAAGTTFTANDITALGFFDEILFEEGINVRAGGLASINGTWAGEEVNVTSNDINISGEIDASDDVHLYSTNATQTVVGDGVGGGGYQLSDAEFDRIHFDGELEVGAWVGGGADDRMLFGNLTATVPSGESEDGVEYEFAVFQSDSEEGTGSMRVLGNMTFSGATGYSVDFATSLFELDVTTGSVSLFSSGTTLAGELGIAADRIHVAEGAILNALASNPTYTNYEQDLREAPAVPRPEGVLRADTISIESDNLQDILIQNTGTEQTRAGFLARQFLINAEDESVGPPGSVNMVINGQVVTEGGTLTGIDARDALITEETDITPFTSNSTINGCPLTGACIIPPPPPPPTDNVVDDFIDLIGDDPLGDDDFGNEEDIDDNEEGDEGADNPISPPQPLFDTRPLIPSGDVNDPVSGTGNPALLGSDQQCEEVEGGECPANPVKGDSQ